MLIAVISDIHANLPALEAVLSAIRPRRPDAILSLGDQINLGPCPNEVLSLLKEHRVTCLHGNHERYVLSVLAGDSAYDGANFESLRWNASRLTREAITFPETLELDGITYCHALPGDDRFPVFDPPRALPLLRERYTQGFTHIVCGHGHNPTHYHLPHLRLDSIGAVGCMDDGVPGAAPYTMLETTEDGAVLRPYYASFDIRRMPGLFRSSGLSEYCPVMARIACTQMMTGRDYLVDFVRRAEILRKEKGEEQISHETWRHADDLFPWPDGLSTALYWKQFR
ncbi:MAG: metallophosphoesterase [Clostridia bacterium]|nr:metallophosphoesterase [Clostridia bacterium]